MKHLFSFNESKNINKIVKGDILYHSSPFYYENPNISKEGVFWLCRNEITSRLYITELTNDLENIDIKFNDLLKKYGLGGTPIFSDEDKMFVIRIEYNKKSPFYGKNKIEKVKIMDKVMKENGIKSEVIGSLIYYDYNKNKYIKLKKKRYLIESFTYKFEVLSDLNLYDIAKNREVDFDNPDFKLYDKFDELNKKGFDGVIINDFSYFKNYNYIEHRSIGIFNRAIGKIKIVNTEKQTPLIEDELLTLINKKIKL